MPRRERKGQFIEDPQFLTNNRTFHSHFISHLGHFTAFDANLNTTYANEWMSAIEAMEEHPANHIMEADIAIVFEEIVPQRELCWLSVADLEYYVKKAFPDNKSKLREFGFPKSNRQRERLTVTMVRHLSAMLKIAEDYTTELAAAGMPATITTGLQSRVADLAALEINHEYQKRLLIRAAEKRIKLYNNIYHLYKRVYDAAKVVYYRKPETRKLWNMP